MRITFEIRKSHVIIAVIALVVSAAAYVSYNVLTRTKPTISTGVHGYVSKTTGNCMPSIGRVVHAKRNFFPA
jgi:hypothetical protein